MEELLLTLNYCRTLSVAQLLKCGLSLDMAKAKEFDLDRPVPVIKDEDEKTLAAIDEGIRDAEAGLVTPIEEVRKRMHKWITGSFSQKER